MMHRLSTVIDGLVGDGRLLFHTPLLFLGVGRIDELAQARSHHIEQHDADDKRQPREHREPPQPRRQVAHGLGEDDADGRISGGSPKPRKVMAAS